MNDKKKLVKSIEELTPFLHFLKHLSRNFLIGLVIVILSLLFGMWGYHHYEKMSWVDAYVNASMILSGMGPVSTLNTEGGKIFAGSYALFSGILFLILMAIILGPILHRVLHKFHLEERDRQK